MASTDRIVKSVHINAPPPKVWKALTDSKECGQWFRVNFEGPFVPGETTRGQKTRPGYEHLRIEVVVQKMEPERLFSYTWHPGAVDPRADYSREPSTLVEFRLEESGAGTLLTVTESGFDKVPSARRDEAFRMHSEGWDMQMQNVKAYVDNAP